MKFVLKFIAVIFCAPRRALEINIYKRYPVLLKVENMMSR
jgi:hypothetical protein